MDLSKVASTLVTTPKSLTAASRTDRIDAAIAIATTTSNIEELRDLLLNNQELSANTAVQKAISCNALAATIATENLSINSAFALAIHTTIPQVLRALLNNNNGINSRLGILKAICCNHAAHTLAITNISSANALALATHTNHYKVLSDLLENQFNGISTNQAIKTAISCNPAVCTLAMQNNLPQAITIATYSNILAILIALLNNPYLKDNSELLTAVTSNTTINLITIDTYINRFNLLTEQDAQGTTPEENHAHKGMIITDLEHLSKYLQLHAARLQIEEDNLNQFINILAAAKKLYNTPNYKLAECVPAINDAINALKTLISAQMSAMPPVPIVALQVKPNVAGLIKATVANGSSLTDLQKIIADDNTDPTLIIAVASHINANADLLTVMAKKQATLTTLNAIATNNNADTNTLAAVVNNLAKKLNCGLLNQQHDQAINLLETIVKLAATNEDTLKTIASIPTVTLAVLQVIFGQTTKLTAALLTAIARNLNANTALLQQIATSETADANTLYSIVSNHNSYDINLLTTIINSPKTNSLTLKHIVKILEIINNKTVESSSKDIIQLLLQTIASHPQADNILCLQVINHPLATLDIINIVIDKACIDPTTIETCVAKTNAIANVTTKEIATTIFSKIRTNPITNPQTLKIISISNYAAQDILGKQKIL